MRRSLRWISVLTMFVVLTGFAALLILGHYPLEGRTVASVLSRGHGIHLGDLFVLGGWLVSVLALGVVAATGSKSR